MVVLSGTYSSLSIQLIDTGVGLVTAGERLGMVLVHLHHALRFYYFFRQVLLEGLIGLLYLGELKLLKVLTTAVTCGNRDNLGGLPWGGCARCTLNLTLR